MASNHQVNHPGTDRIWCEINVKAARQYLNEKDKIFLINKRN